MEREFDAAQKNMPMYFFELALSSSIPFPQQPS
jgi:hypothetical protein